MTKEEAEQLAQYLTSAQSDLAAALECVEHISDTSEAESLRKTLMSVIADVAAYALAPIFENHPELQPPYDENNG